MNILLTLEFSALCTLQNTSDLNDSSLPGTFLANKFSAHIVFPASQCKLINNVFQSQRDMSFEPWQ
jgi:hypothetical protein